MRCSGINGSAPGSVTWSIDQLPSTCSSPPKDPCTQTFTVCGPAWPVGGRRIGMSSAVTLRSTYRLENGPASAEQPAADIRLHRPEPIGSGRKMQLREASAQRRAEKQRAGQTDCRATLPGVVGGLCGRQRHHEQADDDPERDDRLHHQERVAGQRGHQVGEQPEDASAGKQRRRGRARHASAEPSAAAAITHTKAITPIKPSSAVVCLEKIVVRVFAAIQPASNCGGSARLRGGHSSVRHRRRAAAAPRSRKCWPA